MKPLRWIESVNCAIEGILWAARTQRHLRYHFLSAAAVLFVALYLKVSTLEFMLLALAITLVIFAEIINTALEVLVDLVSPDYHILAKRAKDVAAGAVLIASIGAAVLGYLTLSRHLYAPIVATLSGAGAIPGDIALVAVIVVTIAVVLLKALLNRGTPLHGGMPSGHAAVAFSIATSVIYTSGDPVLIIMAFTLAVMVSHSRLLLHIHTLGEVIFGAILGATLTAIIYLIFH